MFEALGPQPVRMFLINPDDGRYERVLSTTWFELESHAYIMRAHLRPFYIMSGHGWRRCLELKGLQDDPQFREVVGVLCANLKNAVKGRREHVLLNVTDVARNSKIPEGIISNIIDSHFINFVLQRIEAEWVSGFEGKKIKVPANFGLEHISA